eukprot:1701171-Alexandrium_andersonii.AAC.1
MLASAARAPRPATGQAVMVAGLPSAQEGNGPRRIAAPEVPSCCTTLSYKSGSRGAASAIPARCKSHAQAERCHWCWAMALRRARARTTPSSQAL